jgi:hypothetical protein
MPSDSNVGGGEESGVDVDGSDMSEAMISEKFQGVTFRENFNADCFFKRCIFKARRFFITYLLKITILEKRRHNKSNKYADTTREMRANNKPIQ